MGIATQVNALIEGASLTKAEEVALVLAIQRYEKALEFYAAPKNWEWCKSSETGSDYKPIGIDGGRTAREVLGK